MQHFLSLEDVSKQQGLNLLQRAIELKSFRNEKKTHLPLQGKILTMIFEKPSTRTRLSFEAGMIQLGGDAVYLRSNDSQLGRGEHIADTARVISSMTDGIMIRCASHQKVIDLAQHSSVAVINGLTDAYHPCQLLADMQTMLECFDSLEGLNVAWLGDINNMTNSYIQAAQLFNFNLRIGAPASMIAEEKNNNNVTYLSDAREAVSGAQVVTTDVWASMGHEEEAKERKKRFQNFAVTGEVMHCARPEAIFLHCLPAYRGEEVYKEVIDGNQSKVWQQAENRLHAQKALLEMLLG